MVSQLFSALSQYARMGVMDAPITRRTDTRATHGGRRSRQTLLLQDGPLVLGIVLGMPVGRWHAEFTVAKPTAREVSRLLCDALGVDDLSQLLCFL